MGECYSWECHLVGCHAGIKFAELYSISALWGLINIIVLKLVTL